MTDVRINVPPRLIEAARAAQYANRAKISNKERLERIKKGIAVQSAQQQKKKFPLTQEREGGQLEFTRVKRQKVWTKRRLLGRGFVIKGKDYQENLLPVEVQNIFEGKNYAFSPSIDYPLPVGTNVYDPVYVFADQRFNIDKATGHLLATRTIPTNYSRSSPAENPVEIFNVSGSINTGEIVFFPLKSGHLTKYELLPDRKAPGLFSSDFFTATSYKNSNGEERRYIEEDSPVFAYPDYQIRNFFELEEFIDSDLPMTLEAKVQLGQFPNPAYAPAPKYDGDESGKYNQTYFSIKSPLFAFTVEIIPPLRTNAWTLRGLSHMPVDSYYFFQGSHELHIAYVYHKNRIQGFLDGSLFLDTKPLFGDISVSFVSGLLPIVINSESYYVDVDYVPGTIAPIFTPSVDNRNYTPSPECCATFKGFRCTMGEALYTDSFTPPESITSLI